MKRLSRGRGDLPAQRGDGCSSARMDRVRENDDEGIARRVHPERSAGKAGVAEAADREDFAARAGKGGVDVPAEAARGDACGWFAVGGEDGRSWSGRGGLLGVRHQLERGLLQRESGRCCGGACRGGPARKGDIAGGGEDSGVACYSAHAAGGGIVDCAAEELVEVGIRRRGSLIVVSGGGGVRDPLFTKPSTRLHWSYPCPPSLVNEPCVSGSVPQLYR